MDIKAGDTVYFDNNSKGTWEVLVVRTHTIDARKALLFNQLLY